VKCPVVGDIPHPNVAFFFGQSRFVERNYYKNNEIRLISYHGTGCA